MATGFYRRLLDADVTPMHSLTEAEAAKLVENAFRDVNIAFVNELAMSFDRLGIDITRVLAGAATKPFGFMPHMPGAGVGGHCVLVDPYYLIDAAESVGFDHRFLKLTREINDGMAEYTVDLLEEEIGQFDEAGDWTIGLLGLAYKAGVADLRGSPALRIRAFVQQRGWRCEAFDPYVPAESSHESLSALISACDAIVLCTDHAPFRALTAPQLVAAGVRVVIDGRNALDGKAIAEAGIAYRGIGRGGPGLM